MVICIVGSMVVWVVVWVNGKVHSNYYHTVYNQDILSNFQRIDYALTNSNYYHIDYTQDISNNFINTKILVKQTVITITQTAVLHILIVLLAQRHWSNSDC